MLPRLLALTVVIVLLGACSIRRMAIKRLADTFAASGEVWASDDDPELVREALPFALKTMESLLVEVPENRDLLLSACRGFTQYSYAFVDTDAELVEASDYEEAERLRERALNLYLRGRDYCLRALEMAAEQIRRRLQTEPEVAVQALEKEDVPLLYWSGASWGLAISLGKHRPEIVADLPAVRALMERALELDADYQHGALHEAMIVLEALPAAMGGSPERARQYFHRAVELSGGERAGPYVTLAEQVSIPTQDRAEFERLLETALGIDADAAPSYRLANRIAQRRARSLLRRIDEFFLESGEEGM